MPPDMTPDEIKFFETGELPPSLTPAPAPDPAPDPSAQQLAEAAALAGAAPAPIPAPQPAAGGSDSALLERLLEEERQRRANLEQQNADIARQLADLRNPRAAAPNDADDPLGAMIYKLNTLTENVTRLETALTDQQQQNLMKQQFDQFTDSIRAVKEAFVRETPDFPDAYAHIRNLRTEDLRAAGMPDTEIPKALFQDELQLAQTALARGKNPAAEMYAMAKRYGYAAKAAADAGAAPGAPTPEEKLAQIALGQQVAGQPDKGASSAAPDTPTLASLRDASAADLSRIVNDPDAWARIVGGAAGGKDIF